jgi:uncharacterized protein
MLKEKIVRDFYPNHGGHGFDHVQRVHKIAIMIAKKEKADLQIVDAASWFHDISRQREDSGKCKCHAEHGARETEKILRKINFPAMKIPAVVHAIVVHRYSKGIKAETKEAKIVQDADRLDALGAICIARVFAHNAENKRPLYDPNIKPLKEYHGENTTAINHFYEKILKIKPELFNTKTARKIAKERYNFILVFLKQFLNEWNGKS